MATPTPSAGGRGVLILALLGLAAVTAGNVLVFRGASPLLSWIVEVAVVGGAVVWHERERAGEHRAARRSVKALRDITAKLGAGDAKQTITEMLAGLGDPKEPVQAIKDIAAERVALSTFLATTKLDDDLEKAAEDLDDEREQHAEAERKLATFLAKTGLDADLGKAAEDLAAERARKAGADQKLAAFLAATKLDADLGKAAADLAAERERRAEADRKLTAFLAATKLDADLGKAAEDLAAERARKAGADQKLATFLTKARLDADLEKAADDLAAERARKAAADEKLTAFLALTGLDADLGKAAADLAAERARNAEAHRQIGAFLAASRLDADLVKAATELAAERQQRSTADQQIASFLTITGLDADLLKAAGDVLGERARYADAQRRLATFLAATGLDADLARAAADLADERERRAFAEAKLGRFLASTGLDADLAEAAADLADERDRHEADVAKATQELADEQARHTETARQSTIELATLRQTMKVAADTAHATKHELSTALDAATIRIGALEAANKEVALDREAAAKKFWTADQSVRVLMSPVVPAGSNYSCIVPKSDGSAKVRLRFVVINQSPYEVKIIGVKFNFTATMDAFQVTGEYNGPPGEPDTVIKLAPWTEQHFFLRVKGTLANPRRYTGGPGTRIAYLFLHDNCYLMVRGHWDNAARAPMTGTTDYILVSWEEFR